MPPLVRLLAAAAALGLWLALYFLGRTAGGAIHLLPLAALALIWGSRRATSGRPSPPNEENLR